MGWGNNMKHRIENGFTIAELVITLALIGLLITPIIINGFQFYNGVNSADKLASILLQSKEALRTITEDLRMASGVETSNSISDPNNTSGWTTSSSNHVLVITSPAQDSSRNFIINASTSKPYQNEIVYYNSGSTFYRRTLPYPVSGNAMVQSCPPASATASCPADTTLTSKFGTSSFTFYNSSDDETSIVASARSVKLTLQLKDNVFGQATTRSNTTQVAFRNS